MCYAIVPFGKIQLVENDRLRNGNREALTALRKRARTTTSSVPSPFESMMRGVAGTSSRPLVQEVCNTCGNHNSSEPTWMMFPGTDLFARIPFHAAHTILETGVWPPYSLTIGKILKEKNKISLNVHPRLLSFIVCLSVMLACLLLITSVFWEEGAGHSTVVMFGHSP